ncbi:hypothetical protein D3C85_1145890 [compost metagenome]
MYVVNQFTTMMIKTDEIHKCFFNAASIFHLCQAEPVEALISWMKTFRQAQCDTVLEIKGLSPALILVD